MNILCRRIDIADAQVHHANEILRREWLLTNGLGGYASGTICGRVSRRYHGLLVAALPAPLGRMVMLNHLSECLRLPDGRSLLLGGDEPKQADKESPEVHYITEFRLEYGLPVWTYEAEGYVIEKSLSVDNLFVFVMIFQYFSTPTKYQHRVLFWGILGALILRAIFIAAGSALLNQFHWMIYVFGAFLVFTGIKMLLQGDEKLKPE